MGCVGVDGSERETSEGRRALGGEGRGGVSGTRYICM